MSYCGLCANDATCRRHGKADRRTRREDALWIGLPLLVVLASWAFIGWMWWT